MPNLGVNLAHILWADITMHASSTLDLHNAPAPTKGWVKWAISKERSDAAAHQNETQRRFHYAASAPAHEQLLTSKRAALQAAMQEQLDLAWEQHAAQHQLDCCSECSTVHEQQQQAVVYEQQCKDSSSSGWAAVAGCRCVAAAGCRCVAVQVAAGCRCASVHEQQQQQAGVHVLQCMSSSSRM
ncbi:hypothetical protein QJQ45_020600 [Haematococcus lacustris]|nr:hypothetical protein QJQ45_020600 [Haematococcus lacustris]